ncbi:hypothetical protein TorRG33x02_348680, partial [Trema orientale]
MSNPLDRYTSAYLLSGYSFNDYRLKSALSLAFEDALDDDHGRDYNLGLRDGGNDLGLGLMDDSLHEDTAVLENLGGVSRSSGGVKGDPRVEDTATPLRATLGFGPSGSSRPVPGFGIVATAGYDIVSTDPIHSLKNKIFSFSHPALLHAGHVKSGLGSGMVAGPPSRPDCLHAGPSTIAKLGHGPSFANVESGCNPQDQI